MQMKVNGLESRDETRDLLDDDGDGKGDDFCESFSVSRPAL